MGTAWSPFSWKPAATHQIRIHMKYLGYPLIGDYLYNPDMEHITRQPTFLPHWNSHIPSQDRR